MSRWKLTVRVSSAGSADAPRVAVDARTSHSIVGQVWGRQLTGPLKPRSRAPSSDSHRACIQRKSGYLYHPSIMRFRLLALCSLFLSGMASHALEDPLRNYPADYAKLLRDAMR